MLFLFFVLFFLTIYNIVFYFILIYYMADIEALRNKITNLEGANTTLYESIGELKNKITDLESDLVIIGKPTQK